MRRHALVLGDRIAEAVPIVDQVANDADTAATLRPPGSAAVGAGQLDFQVVRGRLGQQDNEIVGSGYRYPRDRTR